MNSPLSIVLIHDDIPRAEWKMAVVEDGSSEATGTG